MSLIRLSICVLFVWMLYNLLFVHITEVQALYGDRCTTNDTSNCTQPQLVCSSTRTCDCSQGFIKDTFKQNDTICRPPYFNETCTVNVGCDEEQECANVSGTMICECYRITQYFDPHLGKCAQKPTSGERCDVSTGCVDFYECVDTPPGQATCQCNSSNVYLDDINSMCMPIADIGAEILSTAVSATTVTFRWDGGSPESGVEYNILWTPRDGSLGYTYAEGGQVTGLHSDSQYNFTIVSTIAKQQGYQEKKYLGPNVTVCTKTLYGGQCGICGTCQDDNQICIEAMDTQTRCLCLESYFNATQTGNCTTLDQLTITSITSQSSPTVVNLTWSTSTRLSSVTYNVNWSPSGGHLDSVTSKGAVVSGLSPGNMYYFSVDSVVPGNSYVSAKTTTSPELTVWTKVAHLGVCAPFTNKECEEITVCTLASDYNYRCLCGFAYYFNDTKASCSSTDDLKVSQVTTISSATTITLSWPAKKVSSALNFTIDWTPKVGQLDNISNTGARISGLTSRTLYNFTITSKLLSSTYYPEKDVSAQISPVRTKPAFDETCDVSIGCQDDQHCINISGTNRCQCDSSSEYYNTATDQCLSKPNLNEPCDTTIGCEEFYQCVGTPATCQCNTPNIYFDSISYQCMSMSDLQVSITSTIISATTVTFQWGQRDPDTDVNYNITWRPPSGGKLNYTNSNGGQVSGLQPGTQYNFTIVSILPADSYYPAKSFFGPNVTLCTNILYGGMCDICNICQDNTSHCGQAKDNKYRCLCDNTSYNKTQTGNCSSLSELAVTDISSISSTSSVNLTWTSSVSISSATYIITWYPAGGRVGTVTNRGGQVFELTPGTSYYFTIETVLAANLYDNVKNFSSSEYLTKTQIAYLEDCVPYTNENCQDVTSCNQANDGRFLCMCDNASYFNYRNGNCSSLKDITLSEISATVTPTTVTFTWTAKIDPLLASFKINWSPSGGRLDNITSTGAYVSNLTEGTQYNFTIMFQLPSDNYYPEKSGIMKVYVVNTSLSSQTTDTTPNNSNDKLGLGVGIGVGFFILIIVAVVAVVAYKRRSQTATPLLGRVEYDNYSSGEPGDSNDNDKPHKSPEGHTTGARTPHHTPEEHTTGARTQINPVTGETYI